MPWPVCVCEYNTGSGDAHSTQNDPVEDAHSRTNPIDRGPPRHIHSLPGLLVGVP